MNTKELSLGNRIKEYYEKPFQFKLPRKLPAIIRLDGKSFHQLTKHFEKPFDSNFINGMQNTALYLCEEIQNAKFAYIQSDEISILMIDYDNLNTQAWFDDKIQKIVSVSSGMASTYLTKFLNTTAIFDSRVFVLPESEVVNYFIWRQQDWVRNSIQMLARANFSHKELMNLNQEQMITKLYLEKNILWKHLTTRLKQGTGIYKDEIRWYIDNYIPIFKRDRNYIEQFIPNKV